MLTPEQISNDAEKALESVRGTVSKNVRYLRYAVFGLATVAVLTFGYKLFFYKRPVTGIATVAPEAPKAENVPKVAIAPPKTITVYQRERIIERVPIPAEIKNNPQNQFTATAAIPAAPYGATAVSFVNMSTGRSGITYEATKRPWFGFGGTTELSAGVDIGTRGYTAIIEARQDVLRISGVAIIGTAAVRVTPTQSAPLDATAGVRAVYRW